MNSDLDQEAKSLDLAVITDFRPEPSERDGRRRYEEVLDEAKLADRLGFSTFCTTEQHGVDDGYLAAQLTALAGIGCVTSRIRLMTTCLLLLFHQWRQVVEQAIVVDLLSGGRLRLGVAVGGFEREFDLFSVEWRRRGRLMEQAVPFIRQGLAEGQLPDGPGGSLLPVTPRPIQPRIPILLGGLADAAIDRAVRLGDGALPADLIRPEVNLPDLWKRAIRPALEKHGRSLDDFRLSCGLPLWVAEDPEREWEVVYRPAFEYQTRKYREWAGRSGERGYSTLESIARENLLVDTPEGVARRLLELHGKIPWQEIWFFYRLPGIAHETALGQLELVANHLMPLLRACSSPPG